MNKRLAYIFGTGALAISVLVGCGSQKETFKLYDVSKEIKNSTFKDQIAQVGDVVLREDGSMTVGEVVEELGKNGPILIKDESKNLITENSLIDPMSEGSCALLDEVKVNGVEKEICRLKYVNVTEDALSAYECKVVAISSPSIAWNLNSLNFFYAGNICSGLYGVKADNVWNTEECAKRLKKYPEMEAEDVEDMLRQKGTEDIRFDDQQNQYVGYVYYETPIYTMGGEDYYKVRECRVTIDADTGKVTHMSVRSSFGWAETGYIYHVQDLSCITPEIAEQLESMCVETLTSHDYDAADAAATLEGYFIDKERGSCAVLYTDRGTYEMLPFNLCRRYNGTFGIYACEPAWTDPYESFDEVIEDSDPELDSIIKLNE